MVRSWIIPVSVIAGGITCAAVACYWYSKKRYNAVTDYVLIGHVSGLTIFPVKSMRGVSVQEMECTDIGGKHDELRDRHFMLMDADTGRLVTGRQFPKLLTISVDVHDGTLFLMCDSGKFELNIAEVIKKNDVRRAQLFQGLKQEGLDCGDEIATFLCHYLETSDNLRLLHYVSNLYTERDIVPQENWLLSPVPKRCDPVAFPDECPYMVICDSSLEDLNSRLPQEQRVDMRWFRPVIQISGPPPYDEDMWAELKIKDVTFSCYKPCTRCIMTTINPDTGVRRQNNQPLKLLREYRLAPSKLRKVYGESPVFGVNMGVISKGTIQVGNPVYARYKAHPY